MKVKTGRVNYFTCQLRQDQIDYIKNHKLSNNALVELAISLLQAQAIGGESQAETQTTPLNDDFTPKPINTTPKDEELPPGVIRTVPTTAFSVNSKVLCPSD